MWWNRWCNTAGWSNKLVHYQLWNYPHIPNEKTTLYIIIITYLYCYWPISYNYLIMMRYCHHQLRVISSETVRIAIISCSFCHYKVNKDISDSVRWLRALTGCCRYYYINLWFISALAGCWYDLNHTFLILDSK